MSLVNSDFGDDDPFANATAESADDGMMMQEDGMQPASLPVEDQYRPQEFSIYSVMLICSFVFLTIAAILLFIDAGKY